jgi:hypothetical protein
MVASYSEFAAEHQAEHLTPFNRWCAVIGNYLTIPSAVAALLGRPKTAAALFGLAAVVLGAGHVVEGNFPRSIRDLARHPIWSVRADFAVARATIMHTPVGSSTPRIVDK